MAEVNRREIYRYLGIKGQQEPDLQTKDLVEDCLEEFKGLPGGHPFCGDAGCWCGSASAPIQPSFDEPGGCPAGVRGSTD